MCDSFILLQSEYDTNILRSILESGFDPNTKDEDGRTILIRIAFNYGSNFRVVADLWRTKWKTEDDVKREDVKREDDFMFFDEEDDIRINKEELEKLFCDLKAKIELLVGYGADPYIEFYSNHFNPFSMNKEKLTVMDVLEYFCTEPLYQQLCDIMIGGRATKPAIR